MGGGGGGGGGGVGGGGKLVVGYVTALLIGCLHAGEIWGCVTILALSLDGVPLWDQSILSSPSTVLMDWLGDIP